MIRRTVAYCRLSREDMQSPGTTEDKLRGQEATCLRLAQEHGLTIHEVITETVSGGEMRKRPGLVRLLDMARSGEVGVIVCTFADRLSRLEGRDQYEFEEALSDGGVTVLTTTGTTKYGHDEEPFPRRIMAEAAAYERRAFGRRLKERNKQKIAENRRTGGPCPYGYRKTPEPPYYMPHETEYPYLCRILQGLLAGRSALGIAAELIAEGVPSPGCRNTGRHRGKWSHTTIRDIALNSIHAGRHGSRTKVVRQGGRKRQVRLRPEDYLIAPEDGGWEHPITYDDYLRILSMYSTRRTPAPPKGLLTGVLFCPDGGRMVRNGEKYYACSCALTGGKRTVFGRERLEKRMVKTLARIVGALPIDALGKTGPRTSRVDALQSHAKALRHLRDAEEEASDLMRRASFFCKHFGEAAYQESVERSAAALARAKSEVERLSLLMKEPAPEEIRPFLEIVREVGFETFWEEIGKTERQQFLQSFITRIQMRPKPSLRARNVPPALTFAKWITDCGITPEKIGKV